MLFFFGVTLLFMVLLIILQSGLYKLKFLHFLSASVHVVRRHFKEKTKYLISYEPKFSIWLLRNVLRVVSANAAEFLVNPSVIQACH